jgi:hypothetical protein
VLKASWRSFPAWAQRPAILLSIVTGFACNDDPTGSAGRIEIAVESIDVTGVDGYQVIVTADMVPVTEPRSIGLNDVILVEGLEAGVYLVTLVGAPPGCQGADPGDPQGVMLEESGFARMEFTVVCPVPQS